MNFDFARQQMIDQQLRASEVVDERVLEVIAVLKREDFVPPEWRGLAYADAEIPLGHGRTLAPPRIQGRLLEALKPRVDETVLEIGTGSGYLTACLGLLARDVTSVESTPGLAEMARRNLAAAGIDNARVVVGDPYSMDFSRPFDVMAINGSLPVWDERFQALLTVGGRLFVVTGQPPVMRAHLVTRVGLSDWSRQSLFETCLPPLESARRPEAFTF